jgi:hypothetical protein
MQNAMNDMKKIILTTVLAFAVLYVDAQPYKAWSEYGTDTLNYIKYNFETRKSQYIGYTLEKIINDYELPINQVNSDGPFIQADNKSYMKGVGISSLTRVETRRRWNTKTAMIMFTVYFEPPYEDEWAFWHYAPKFNSERERALYVKDKIVSDIKVVLFQPKTFNTTPPTPPPPTTPPPANPGKPKKPRELRPIDDTVLQE